MLGKSLTDSLPALVLNGARRVFFAPVGFSRLLQLSANVLFQQTFAESGLRFGEIWKGPAYSMY